VLTVGVEPHHPLEAMSRCVRKPGRLGPCDPQPRRVARHQRPCGARYGAGLITRAVIDDDDLLRRKGLRDATIQAIRQEVWLVAMRDDDGYADSHSSLKSDT
jgi:hypothetical protein